MNYSIVPNNGGALKVNKTRRWFLTTATTVAGVVGAGFVSVPFIKSWLPSERAKLAGAPVQIDVSKLEPGRQLTVEWRSKPVFILMRTPEILQRLAGLKHLQKLRDPDSEVGSQQPVYTRNAVRSIRDETFVVIGLCTHLGCVPTFRPDIAPQDLGPAWIGGWFCPCHASRFDFAGRVLKNVPAPTNLVVPPYRFVTNTVIEIGVDTVQS